jgi:hypothetical protein
VTAVADDGGGGDEDEHDDDRGEVPPVLFFSDSTLDLRRGVARPPAPSYWALLREAMEARLRSAGVEAGDSLLLLLLGVAERRKSILALRGSGAAGGEKC